MSSGFPPSNSPSLDGQNPRIRAGFRLPLPVLFTHIFLLQEVTSSSVDKDIELYFREKFTLVAKRGSEVGVFNSSPSHEDLTVLTKKPSGLFIIVSTLAGFIASE